MLHRLGVHMGDDWHRTPEEQPDTYEERRLWAICRTICDEPHFRRRLPPAQTVRLLAAWARRQRAEAAARGLRPGAKHPLLCAMIPAVRIAFAPLVAVAVERPLEVSIRSLQARDWWGSTPRDYAAVQRTLWQRRERELASIPHITLAFADVLTDPGAAAERLAGELELRADAAMRREAAAFVRRGRA
jgi:hypothetical protein